MIRLYYQLLGSSSVTSNLPKRISYPPSTASQRSELNNLTVIYKKIDIIANSLIYQLETAGSAASNITFSIGKTLQDRLDDVRPSAMSSHSQ